MKKYLLDQLTEYTNSDAYPLHMPGHKRQMRFFEHPYEIDITEIDGFDNLHHPEGILKEAQNRAAELYGADETHFLVNGSTGGILAAVSATVPRGGRILMARNSHKSAFHAALINGLRVAWLYPDMDMRRGIYGSIHPEQVREALRNDDSCLLASRAVRNDVEVESASGNSGEGLSANASEMAADIGELSECGNGLMDRHTEADFVQGSGGGARGDRIAAVLITSPTYDGVVSDIRAIAREVHQAGAILIVDEAHGAHFAMHPYFPESALALGADLVINSLHKTMPSLTQTALLHIKGGRIDRERLRFFLGVYQSSSPSYVLMAGMDECIRLMESRRKELFDGFVRRLEALRQSLSAMKVLHLVTGDEPELNAFAFDRSKIVISTEAVDVPDGMLSQAEDELIRGALRRSDSICNSIRSDLSRCDSIRREPICRCTDDAASEDADSLADDINDRITGRIANQCMTGAGLAQILRTCYHLEIEMASEHYVTAIVTVADTQEGFDRLEKALLEIDTQLCEGGCVCDVSIQESVSECRRLREPLSGNQQLREPVSSAQRLRESASGIPPWREPDKGSHPYPVVSSSL